MESTNPNNLNQDADNRHWQNVFFNNYLYELNKSGYKPEDISKYVWKPFAPEDLIISGPDKDLSFFKVRVEPPEIKRYIERLSTSKIDSKQFLTKQKLVFILFPGFTHHTLKFPAFIAQNDFKNSPVDVYRFSLSEDENSCIEKQLYPGEGVKLTYIAYPRSNASSKFIIGPSFKMLSKSNKLRDWVDQGYKIVFIGYSYGSVLALELMAGMNSKEFEDDFILQNTIAFLSINGDIRGSYLADAVLKTDAVMNMQKYVSMTEKFPPLGLFMGLKNEQERDDLVGGVKSLAHPERLERLNEYIDKMPSHIKYFSICAFLPENDYQKIWKNFDDWTMYKQSLASKDISIYNDGQMVLEDCFLPKFTNVPPENIIEMGAVRAHHWAVSFPTFNFGDNKFPRFPYYRAIGKTMAEAGITN